MIASTTTKSKIINKPVNFGKGMYFHLDKAGE